MESERNTSSSCKHGHATVEWVLGGWLWVVTNHNPNRYRYRVSKSIDTDTDTDWDRLENLSCI